MLKHICHTSDTSETGTSVNKYACEMGNWSYFCQPSRCCVVHRTEFVPCTSVSASMRVKGGIPSIVVVTVVMVLLMQPHYSTSQSLDAILPLLASQLVSLFQSNELQFMGFQCFYTQYPRFKSWQLYYKGSFICPSWTAIRGRAETRSRSGVMRATIENFLERISDANLVTEEEARAWLEGQTVATCAVTCDLVVRLADNHCVKLQLPSQVVTLATILAMGKTSLMVVMVVMVLCAQQANAQDFRDLIPAISQQIAALWQNRDFHFLGTTCRYDQQPRIKRWQLYYRGRLTCPGYPGIQGRGDTRSRSGVMLKTIEDFLRKASAAGRVSEEEVRIWLEGFAD
ncbi:Anti-lipopolysaccharide factor/Scygonadin [Trinorchestia longiramus]|nr:Anti-lipopolysaccharide factor/Scygonadin [Trinorchestia longiramus]